MASVQDEQGRAQEKRMTGATASIDPEVWHYRSCGLAVSSDLPLAGMIPASPSAAADLALQAGEARPTPRTVPPGDRIVDAGDWTENLYSAVRDDAGVLFRFSGTCDVRLTADLRHATYLPDPNADTAKLSVLFAGTILSFVLALRGACVLHASAVVHRGTATAFVGYSGMGKSTLTAAACGSGASLLTEDVLVVEDSAPPLGLLGNQEIRLREKAASIAKLFAASAVAGTADERLAVRPTSAMADKVPISALVIPNPSRTTRELTIEQLTQQRALMAILSFPRVVGLCEPDHAKRQFEDVARIVAQVPVVVATVPWGPPFSPRLGDDLLAMAAGLTSREFRSS
jgi:hypothetical protein